MMRVAALASGCLLLGAAGALVSSAHGSASQSVWRRVGSARLAPHRMRFYTFVASFTVPRRGLTLRVLVPAKTAAPCFGAQASEPWIS